MSHNLFMVFSEPADSIDLDEFNAFQDQHIRENLENAGMLSCRRYSLAQGRASEPPAGHRFVSIYEVDRDREGLRAGRSEKNANRTTPDWFRDGVKLTSRMCQAVDGGDDPTAPDTLFIVYSGVPSDMDLDTYVAWYGQHMKENIAGSELLRNGWRYVAAGAPGSPEETPAHVALYDLGGPAAEMLEQTHRAVDSGRTSMIDTFHTMANFEATALDVRVTAAG